MIASLYRQTFHLDNIFWNARWSTCPVKCSHTSSLKNNTYGLTNSPRTDLSRQLRERFLAVLSQLVNLWPNVSSYGSKFRSVFVVRTNSSDMPNCAAKSDVHFLGLLSKKPPVNSSVYSVSAVCIFSNLYPALIPFLFPDLSASVWIKISHSMAGKCKH